MKKLVENIINASVVVFHGSRRKKRARQLQKMWWLPPLAGEV
jgi:hypothetical protein